MSPLLGLLSFTLCSAASLAAAPQEPPPAFPQDALDFRCIGPTRGGRVTTVAGVRQQPGTYFMGASGGGVWKTTDHGENWRCVSDGAFASPSIGAIRVAPSNPDIVYVGTGSDGLRSNVIAGKGVYKSTDAGESWSFLGLKESAHIGAVEVHPHNPDVVFVAAIGSAFGPNEERGLYRSRDGGKNWERVLYISDTCGACDVEFHPTDPQVMYATTWKAERKPWTILSGGREGGVYKSTDGGNSWRRLEDGLPTGGFPIEDRPLFGKADLAVSAADPNRVYLLIEAPGDKGGVYRSADAGETWLQVNDDRGPRVRPFYYTNIDCDPNDADRVFVCATGFYESTNGGRSFRSRRTPHGDNHDLWIHPDDSKLWVQANDGGANCTIDNGRTWSTQTNQPTAELYQVHADDRFPYWLYAGQQDNSTIRVPSKPPYPSASGALGYWESVGGCETGPAVPKPGNADIVFAACKGRFGVYDARTGQERHYDVTAANMYGHNPKELIDRFQRVSPIHVSPHDPDLVYHASQYLYATLDNGKTWTRISEDLTAFDDDKQVISGGPITRDITGEEFYSTIYAVQESAAKRGVIWVGANDGPIHVSTDSGQHWRNVTPPDLPRGGRVQTVEPSPHDPKKAYACVLRYQFDDWQPHLYRTDDTGKTWTRISTEESGFPQDHPVRVIREDPTREGLLYCGTEWGLFVSFDDGAHWQSMQSNLPVTPITDMKVHGDDLVMSTMGRSFWILDDLTRVRQWDADVADSTFALMTPKTAIRTRLRGGRGGVPNYGRNGAVLDYMLGKGFEGTLSMEIRDQRGELVRGFSSEADGERWVVPEQPAMHRFELQRVGTPRLDNEPGLHRFYWDLRHAGPWSPSRRGAGRGGPMVSPGRYMVKMIATPTNGAAITQEVQLTVEPDPRLALGGVTPDDLRDQEELALDLRDTISRARVLQKRVGDSLDDAKDEQREELTAIRDELETERGTYMKPMLLDQLRYLSRVIGGADQAPGRDAVRRHAGLRNLLSTLMERFQTAMAGQSAGGDGR